MAYDVNTVPTTLEEARQQLEANKGKSLEEIIAGNQKSSGLNPNSFENLQGAFSSGIQNFTDKQAEILKQGNPNGYSSVNPTGIDGVSNPYYEEPSNDIPMPQAPKSPLINIPISQVVKNQQFPQLQQPQIQQTPRIDYASLLREALNNNKPLAPTDNSASIEANIAAKLKAALARNAANINQGISDQNSIIQNIDQKYQPQINDSEVAKYNQLRSVLEQSANAGDRGGIGRQNALETQTQGDNRLNNIRLAIQGVKDQANKTIADLQAAGRSQDAIDEANAASEKINALINESNRIDAINRENANTGYLRALDVLKFGAEQQNADRNFDYNSSQDMIRNALSEAGLTGQYNGAATMAKQAQDNEIARQAKLDKEKADIAQKSEYASLMANLGDQIDYSAEIDKILNDGDTSNDWKIPILQQERQKKIDKKAETNAIKLQQDIINRQKQDQLEQDRLYNEARIRDMLKPSNTDPNSDLDRLYKQAQIDALQGKNESPKQILSNEQIKSAAKAMKEDEGGIGGVGRFSVADVKKYVLDNIVANSKEEKLAIADNILKSIGL